MKKTNRGIGIIFFLVLMITLLLWRHRDKIWYKENARESNRDCKSYGTICLSFKIAIGLS